VRRPQPGKNRTAKTWHATRPAWGTRLAQAHGGKKQRSASKGRILETKRLKGRARLGRGRSPPATRTTPRHEPAPAQPASRSPKGLEIASVRRANACSVTRHLVSLRRTPPGRPFFSPDTGEGVRDAQSAPFARDGSKLAIRNDGPDEPESASVRRARAAPTAKRGLPRGPCRFGPASPGWITVPPSSSTCFEAHSVSGGWISEGKAGKKGYRLARYQRARGMPRAGEYHSNCLCRPLYLALTRLEARFPVGARDQDTGGAETGRRRELDQNSDIRGGTLLLAARARPYYRRRPSCRRFSRRFLALFSREATRLARSWYWRNAGFLSVPDTGSPLWLTSLSFPPPLRGGGSFCGVRGVSERSGGAKGGTSRRMGKRKGILNNCRKNTRRLGEGELCSRAKKKTSAKTARIRHKEGTWGRRRRLNKVRGGRGGRGGRAGHTPGVAFRTKIMSLLFLIGVSGPTGPVCLPPVFMVSEAVLGRSEGDEGSARKPKKFRGENRSGPVRVVTPRPASRGAGSRAGGNTRFLPYSRSRASDEPMRSKEVEGASAQVDPFPVRVGGDLQGTPRAARVRVLALGGWARSKLDADSGARPGAIRKLPLSSYRFGRLRKEGVSVTETAVRRGATARGGCAEGTRMASFCGTEKQGSPPRKPERGF